MRIFAHFLLLTATGTAFAAGLDPFGTAAITPPAPSPQVAGRQGDVPCAREIPGAPLSAIESDARLVGEQSEILSRLGGEIGAMVDAFRQG